MSAASQLFDWKTARAALNAGWRVRFVGWADQNQWWERWTGGLIWLILSEGDPRVVQNTDYGAAEFTIPGWTNLPASCITSGTTPGTGTNGCPLPFSPQSAAGTPATATNNLATVALSPSTPPSPIGGAGQIGFSGSSTITRPPSSPRVAPTLTISAGDSSGLACYANDTPTTATIGVGFVLTGDPSYGLCLVSLYIGSTLIFSEWHMPTLAGTTGDTTWEGPVSPGGTLTFKGRVWTDGAPDAFATTTCPLKKYCNSVTITAAVTGRMGGTSGESFAVLLDGGPIGSVDGTGAAKTFNVRCSPGNHSVTIPILELPPGTIFEGGVNITGTTFGSASVGVTDYTGTSIGESLSAGADFTMP